MQMVEVKDLYLYPVSARKDRTERPLTWYRENIKMKIFPKSLVDGAFFVTDNTEIITK